MPGAWAPSTSVSMPRSSSARTSRSIGSTSAVGLVTWLTTASRVRGVTAPSIASITASGPSTGNGTRATTTRAPSRAATAWSVVRIALYSWSLVSSSSPGSKRSGLEHGIRAGRGVGHEREPGRIGAEERRDVLAGRVEATRQLTVQERHGLALQPVAQLALDGEDRLRAGPERSRGSDT